MKIVPRPISGSPLVVDYLAGREPALGLFGGLRPDRIESYRSKLDEVDARFDQEARLRLAGELRGGGGEAEERLARFVEDGGVAVTTGQQPGLLGGPLYTLYKALSASKLAERLERVLHRPVIPVFWVASQDHDWAEVRRTHLPDLSNNLATVELELPGDMAPHPFHVPDLGLGLAAAREALLGHLPETDFSGAYRTALEATHTPGRTLADAETSLLEGLLGPLGVFVLRPDAPEAARAALPVLLAELAEARDREEALRERAARLESGGYSLQVPLMDRGANLFLSTDRGRERLYRAPGGGFRTRHGQRERSVAELEAIARTEPSRLTPNVLLRPVVETALVPTLAYVAGPGETAYFPQTVPLFAAAGRTPPIVHPRLSAFVVESKVEKVLKKFELELDQLRRPHHELAGELTREEIPDDLRGAMGGLRGEIARRCREIADAVTGVDPTLKGTVDGVRSQGFAALDDLQKKVTQALKRENEIALQQLEKAQLHLFPHGSPQERVFSPFYYLFRYGPRFISELEAVAGEALLLEAAGEVREGSEAGQGSRR